MTIYSQFRESTTYLKLGMQREGNNIPSKIALSKSTYTYWEQDSFPTQIFFLSEILKNNPSLYVTSTSYYSPQMYMLYGLCYVMLYLSIMWECFAFGKYILKNYCRMMWKNTYTYYFLKKDLSLVFFVKKIARKIRSIIYSRIIYSTSVLTLKIH